MGHMSIENQRIIQGVLRELDLRFDEPNDLQGARFRIFINDELTSRNIFYNIPKIETFKFQLIFQNGETDIPVRNNLRNILAQNNPNNYRVGGSSNYLTIYLSQYNGLEISENTMSDIYNIIRSEINFTNPIIESYIQL